MAVGVHEDDPAGVFVLRAVQQAPGRAVGESGRLLGAGDDGVAGDHRQDGPFEALVAEPALEKGQHVPAEGVRGAGYTLGAVQVRGGQQPDDDGGRRCARVESRDQGGQVRVAGQPGEPGVGAEQGPSGGVSGVGHGHRAPYGVQQVVFWTGADQTAQMVAGGGAQGQGVDGQNRGAGVVGGPHADGVGLRAAQVDTQPRGGSRPVERDPGEGEGEPRAVTSVGLLPSGVGEGDGVQHGVEQRRVDGVSSGPQSVGQLGLGVEVVVPAHAERRPVKAGP